MATFGRYEADRPLYRTAFSTVYALRSTEESGRQRVIKAQKLSVRMHDETLEAAQGRAFLDSATVQQKVARFEAESWAPVHELGTAVSGPFYVTDRYDFSIQGLVDGHVKLGAAGLHNVASSIVRGLLALRQACQRPHGNLKSTNILIAGHRDLSQAKIVLCDPLPDRHLDPDAHALADLRRLGEIIHQVVVHGEVPPITGYQAPPSAHWRKLGKQGEAWRHLCNRLLQANVESAPVTLEDLADQLTALAPRRSRRALLMASGIAVAVSILLGILCLRPLQDILFSTPLDPNQIKQAQEDLAKVAGWLKPLGKVVDERISPGIKKPTNQQQKKYLADIGTATADKILVELLGNILSCAAYFDAPESYRPEKMPSAVDASAAVARRLFHVDTRWPWLIDLEKKHAPKLREKSCLSLAEYLEGTIHLIPQNEPNKPNQEVCENIRAGFEAVLDLRTKWPGSLDLDKLEPKAIAEDPKLAGRIAGANEFLTRLSLLPNHYRLEGDPLTAFNKELADLTGAVDDFLQELQRSGAKSDDPNLMSLTGYGKKLQAVVPTKGGFEQLGALRKLIEAIETPPETWYTMTREKAKTEIGKSPRLNGWYRSYVEDRTGERAIFLEKYKALGKPFRDLKEEVKQTRESFILFTEDYSRIETALQACYLLEETPPAAQETLQTVCDRWRKNQVFDKVPKNEPYATVIADLRDRVQELEDIRRVQTVDGLLNEAKTGRWLEARYAAWRRLDTGTPPAWPLTERQWKEEADIQSRLKKDLEQATGLADRRGTEFNSLCEIRERTYRNSRLNELVSEVQARASGVAILRNIGRARPQTNADLGGLQEFERTLQSVVGVLTSDAWSTQYDLGEFQKDHTGYFADATVFGVQDIENWRKALADYKRIPDPRGQAKLSQEVKELEGQIAAGLQESVGDPNLEADRKQRQILSERIDEIEKLPAISKNEDTITKTWADLGRELAILRGKVEGHRWPPECKYLTIAQGTVRFKANAGFDTFEPVERNSSGSGVFGPLSRSTPRALRGDTAFEASRTQAPLGADNPIWPKYIRAKQDRDPNVVLRFVPQDKPTDPLPFYMAIQEITNGQFAKFLDVNRPADVDRLLATEFRAGNAAMNRYPRAINPKTHEIAPLARKNHPVVWVTYQGAERYAKWLHAELPRSSWPQRAIAYCSGRGAPDPNWYHTRGQAWEAAVREYNDTRTDPMNRKYAPVGAMFAREFPGFKEWNELPYVYQKPPLPANAPRDEWPQPSQARKGLEIFDLIGNVWEWSPNSNDPKQPYIYGGSCLSSPTNAAAEPQLFDGTSACDVGFRIAVPCPETGRSDGNPVGSVRIGR